MDSLEMVAKRLVKAAGIDLAEAIGTGHVGAVERKVGRDQTGLKGTTRESGTSQIECLSDSRSG